MKIRQEALTDGRTRGRRLRGVRTVGREIGVRLVARPLIRRLVVMTLPLTGELERVEPEVPATFEELRPFLKEELIRLRLDAGHRFYVTKVGGRIVQGNGVAFGKAFSGYLDMAFPLAPEEGYVYEAYTVPEYRGKRLYSAALSRIARELRGQGYRRLVVFVYPRNRPALQAHSRMGFQPQGHIGYVELLGVRRYFYRVTGEGLGCLRNSLFVRKRRLVPPEIQGTIW